MILDRNRMDLPLLITTLLLVGIGAVMMRAGRFLKVDIIMAGILTIGILGVLTDLAFRLLAHYAFPWNRERQN